MHSIPINWITFVIANHRVDFLIGEILVKHRHQICILIQLILSGLVPNIVWREITSPDYVIKLKHDMYFLGNYLEPIIGFNTVSFSLKWANKFSSVLNGTSHLPFEEPQNPAGSKSSSLFSCWFSNFLQHSGSPQFTLLPGSYSLS